MLLALAAGCGLPVPGLDTGSEGDASSGAGSSGPGVTSTSGPSSTAGPSGGSTSGLDTATSDSTGTNFIEPTDGCGQGPGGSVWHCSFECSVIEQDCPVDEKCMPWANDGGPAWNASRCSPNEPEAVPTGGTCTVEGFAVSGIDDCELGSMCWAVDPDTLQGTCKAFCDSAAPDACDGPQRCVPLNDGEVPVCLSACDPRDPSSCAEGEACRFVPEHDFSCLPLQGGLVLTSAVCTDEICEPDSTCVDGASLPSCAGPACCSPWCDDGDPGADAGCAALDPALGCEPFYARGAAPLGLETLGACASPP